MAESWIYGVHAVTAALDAGEVECLWIATERHADKRFDGLKQLAAQQQIPVATEEGGRLTGRCGASQHQGVIARALPKPAADLNALIGAAGKEGLFLVLDGVMDPHNLGACLRSAEAAGVTGVILPKDHACPINGTVRKAAAGAASRVPVLTVTNLSRTLEQLQSHGYWVAGLAGQGTDSLYTAPLSGPLVVVMGSEDKGIRRLVREHCDFLLQIPMFGQAESLNVSVATGVALFEVQRQRQAQRAPTKADELR